MPNLHTPERGENETQAQYRQRQALSRATADQVLTKMFGGTSYMVTAIVAVGRTGGASVSCLGGIYTAASKGGSALVAAAQSWLGVTGVAKINPATLAAIVQTDVQTASPLYFSLTTGSTAACTADVFVFGVLLD